MERFNLFVSSFPLSHSQVDDKNDDDGDDVNLSSDDEVDDASSNEDYKGSDILECPSEHQSLPQSPQRQEIAHSQQLIVKILEEMSLKKSAKAYQSARSELFSRDAGMVH